MNKKYRNLVNAMPDINIGIVDRWYKIALRNARQATKQGDIYTAKQWKHVFNAAADQLVERGV